MIPRTVIELGGWGRVFESPVMRELGARRLDPRPTRIFLRASVRLLIAAFSIVIARPGTAQEAASNAPSTNAKTAQFLGVDRCERCHQAPTKADIDDHVTDFVLLNESKIWISDIHSRAYQLIDPASSALSKQICDKLQIADISREQQCLSCHSNWLADEVRPPTYQRGVACESCHGPSEHWDVPHSRADWRKKPIVDKEALGMIDVRNPIKRAEQCFGCHIGNAAEGKVITHSMYAAGHPPLPGIEIESFAAQMPRHWRYLDEKMATARSRGSAREVDATSFAHFEEFVRENHGYLKLGEDFSNELVLEHNHHAAAVVLGGVVALRESMELMRDLSGEAELQESSWPELTTYDCRACHHELEAPGWRQQRRAGSTPGRPMISNWPSALVRLAIRHVSNSRPSYDRKLAEFVAKLAAVQSELQRTPFGSPSRIHEACSELSEWLTTEVVEPVSARPFDDRAVADAINVLIVIGSTEQHDFDSARQIAWALRILSCAGSTDDTRGRKLRGFLDKLAPELRLDLANGPGDVCDPISVIDDTRKLTPLAADLTAAMAVPFQYDSDRFREEMRTLRGLLR